MPRPTMPYLGYFTLDTRIDEKLKLIKAEYGLLGYGIIICLWQMIYGGDGYYAKWNNEVRLLFAQEHGVSCDLVSEVINAALRRGLFDKGLYDKYGILTSRGIQKRYFDAVKRRKGVEATAEYLLVSRTIISDCVNINSITVDINSINADSNATKEKRREDKIREDKNTNSSLSPTLKNITDYCINNNLKKVNQNKFFEYYANRNWQTKNGKPIDWQMKLKDWDTQEETRPTSVGVDYAQRSYSANDYEARLQKAVAAMENAINDDFEV